MQNIEKRQDFKDIILDNRTFRIRKFDALTGSYIAYKLMSEALPMGLGKGLGIPEPKESKTMSKADFIDTQKDCLKVCFEVLPAGEVCIMNENGTFGVLGLERDTKNVLALTAHSLMFNISGFFGEDLLGSITKGLQTISQQDAKI
jgi:hypothetical protein